MHYLAFLFFLFSSLFLSAKEHATVAFYAVHMPTGKVVREKDSEKSLIPGSCMKIVTTGAALHLLGPEGVFETKLEEEGKLDERGVLHGNLYLHGGGDPCLGSERISSSLGWQELLDVWAEAIYARGIRQIEGKVLPDLSCWESAHVAPGWAWEDLGNAYGAGASALSFHENSYDLVFKPGSVEGAATTILRTDPPLDHMTFQNEVKTGPRGSGDQACIYPAEFSTHPVVRGTIPLGVNEFCIRGALLDPAAFCTQKLIERVRRKGIVVLNKTLPKGKRRVFHTTRSPSIQEIVYWTNQKSINLYAEHLLKRMGEVVKQSGSTQGGTQAVREFWASQGIDLAGFHMTDGSGLSRTNLITAKQLVSILIKLRASAPFVRSLSERTDQIRGKSGGLRFIKAYAGYKGEIAFAILINHCASKKEAEEKIESFLSKL